MSTLENNKLTTETIGNIRFRIPLYQRLFEWDKEQIEQLLRDLKTAKEEGKDHYYIGMLTTKRDNDIWDLVDGQQRFIVLMLMGIVFKWKEFLFAGDHSRLTFFARKKDEAFLEAKMKEEKCDYVNRKMENGIEIINTYLETEFQDKDKKKDFANYIYKSLTFFVSELPAQYDMVDLNKYFESMNATGKGLESHEILKVKLLKKMDNSVSKENYTRVWNCVSQMNKQLVRIRNNETVDALNDRFINAICTAKNHNITFGEKGKCVINELYMENVFKNENDNTIKSIRDIRESTQQPAQQLRSEGDRSFMNFSEFLLQVLYLSISDEQREKAVKTDFFDTHKLLSTFENYDNCDVRTFFDNLLIYRLLFDYFIIRIKNDDGFYLLENLKDSDHEQIKCLIQYQSMLYVFSSSLSYYKWLTPLLQELFEKHTLSAKEILDLLKGNDNKEHAEFIRYLDDKNEIYNKLSFKHIDRYWFWRLDYYLWEKRFKYFMDEKHRKIAEKYIFRRNRSIEHVAPQNPKHDTTESLKWNQDDKDDLSLRDCFGNLCMISNSQNSSLQNESFKIKRAYVETVIDKSGTIESLKLLKIFEYEKWDKEHSIPSHGEEMLQILRESFPTNNSVNN